VNVEVTNQMARDLLGPNQRLDLGGNAFDTARIAVSGSVSGF